MPERCPMSDMEPGSLLVEPNIPDICQRLCDLAITEALRRGGEVTMYETYIETDCDHVNQGHPLSAPQLDYSHSGLHRLDGATRDLTTVYTCAACGGEVCEES